MFHDQRTRNFQRQIADEKNARAKTKDRLRKLEILRHVQLGERHVRAVQVRDDVENEDERQNPPGDLLPNSLLIEGKQRDNGFFSHAEWLIVKLPSYNPQSRNFCLRLRSFSTNGLRRT